MLAARLVHLSRSRHQSHTTHNARNIMASTTNWVGPFLKSSLCPGQGLIVEGTVKELRSHSVFVRETSAAYDQGDALPTRYIVLVLEIQQAYERIFDKRGDEIDYMGNLKFKKTYIEPTILTHAQVAARIGRGYAAGRESRTQPRATILTHDRDATHVVTAFRCLPSCSSRARTSSPTHSASSSGSTSPRTRPRTCTWHGTRARVCRACASPDPPRARAARSAPSCASRRWATRSLLAHSLSSIQRPLTR